MKFGGDDSSLRVLEPLCHPYVPVCAVTKKILTTIRQKKKKKRNYSALNAIFTRRDDGGYVLKISQKTHHSDVYCGKGASPRKPIVCQTRFLFIFNAQKIWRIVPEKTSMHNVSSVLVEKSCALAAGAEIIARQPTRVRIVLAAFRRCSSCCIIKVLADQGDSR